MYFRKINRVGLLVFVVSSLLASCITSKEIKYLQGNKGKVEDKFTNKQVEYLVQPGDNLYIKFNSTEDITNQIFASENVGTVGQGFESKYRNVYLVDNEGNIKLPQLDKIKVEGKCIGEIKDTIDYCINKYYSQMSTQVRLADNYVTILGDVNKPGRYVVDFKDKINIFELLGMAGDMSFEARRDNVKLIRKKGKETEIVVLDLTKQKIIENDYYYIMPNDVVYVEPLRATSWHLRSFPFATTLALVLSTTTTILVIVSYFK
jgi:polysaccharide export outer membrane protein